MRLLLALLLLVPQEDKLEPAFKIVREAVEKDEVPGALVLVAQRGKILRYEAHGLADLENKTPFAKDTLCWIASITKPVTVAAAMTLVDAGKIALDDPVENHLAEFKDQVDEKDVHHAFTIRHLMTHSSGLQQDSPTRKSTMGPDWRGQKIDEIVKTVARTKLQFKPGEKEQYSNAGMIVLGRIIEVASGKDYATCVKEKILDPLGMKDSYYHIPAREAGRVAACYNDRGGKRQNYFRFDPEFKVVNTAPNGGLFAHPGEFAKFMQMFLDNDGTVLSKKLVDEMLKEQRKGRGLEWSLSDGAFGHGGSSGTFAWADPKTGVVAILFFQCAGKHAAILDRFLKAVRAAYK